VGDFTLCSSMILHTWYPPTRVLICLQRLYIIIASEVGERLKQVIISLFTAAAFLQTGAFF